MQIMSCVMYDDIISLSILHTTAQATFDYQSKPNRFYLNVEVR